MNLPSASSHPLRRHFGVSALAVAGLAGLVLSACSSTPSHHAAAGTLPTVRSSTTTSTTTPPTTCPLTGTAVPGGGPVPGRPALAVKVDNYPAARPQSGLDQADIVFEEPVEGGITRYVVVFQCRQATGLVGPVRSARNIDIGILGQFGNPLLVHVGGIDPVLANIEASPLVNVDLGNYGNLETNPAGRYAPYDTYSTTAQLWSTHATMTTPPQPLFSFSSSIPAGGTPANGVGIDFSGTSDVTWKYNATIGAYQRFYNGTTPDLLADGTQNTAANVVVQYVQISYGPWVENSEGNLEVQADLYPNASGNAEIFRGGYGITGTWSRATLGSPTKFVSSAGKTITLQPGQTWVELVPNTIAATVTP